MPLDFELIDKSIAHSKKQIELKDTTDSVDLFFVEDFLHPELLQKLVGTITSEPLEWKKVQYQEYQNRLEVTWLPDSVIEETHIVLESLTESIGNIWNGPRKFLGISIWQDQSPYSIRPHSDQSLIGYSLQVYLNTNDKNLSTQFQINDNIVGPKYQTNCGYLMNNDSKILHWMLQDIPKNFTRYSLYAIWKD